MLDNTNPLQVMSHSPLVALTHALFLLGIWDQYLAPFNSTSARIYRGEKFIEVFGDHYDAVEKTTALKLEPAPENGKNLKPPSGNNGKEPQLLPKTPIDSRKKSTKKKKKGK
jgi:hypothetical protein